MILYHAGCADGFTSCWVAHRATGHEYVGVQYEQPVPPIKDGSVVYILDFSYTAAELLELAGRMEKVVVLDHHKTTEEGLRGLVHDRLEILFDNSKSGAMLTWEYFHPGVEAPWLVRYVQDRDLWTWKLEKSREVSAAISSYEMEMEIWDFLNMWKLFQEIVSDGEAILRYQRKVVRGLAGRSREGVIARVRCGVLNSCVLASELGEEIGQSYGIGVVWFQTGEGRFVYSLRSTTVDVSVIARSFGGGGHKNASGFSTKELLNLCDL